MMSFAELYQTYQTEYDMWDFKNMEQITLFLERFETRVNEFEDKMSKTLKKEDPFATKGKCCLCCN